MRTITFYSYKGGTGRTLLAANSAVYFAKFGQRTVLVDFDLDAPGLDSKFLGLELNENQKGLLDYILAFQKGVDLYDFKEIAVEVPINSTTGIETIHLIPAGYYLSPEYYRKLNELNWDIIFSEQREGVAFFQQFLKKIAEEFKADFLLVDSRTGISEISGICTQQLADEVILLSNFSSESIKVTKLIAKRIHESKIAEVLGKVIDVKIVVSRVPKPENFTKLKESCCDIFEIEDSKLFFLFSSRSLEEEEFIALAGEIDRDDELLQGYLKLFAGMNVDISGEIIEKQIEDVSKKLLLSRATDAIQSLEELAALYPHPDVYRAVMRFYHFTKDSDNIEKFAWKLLDIIPEDDEAEMLLASRYTEKYYWDSDTKNKAIQILDSVRQRGKLGAKGLLKLAKELYENEEYQKSLDVARELLETEKPDDEALVIAAKSAFKSGQEEEGFIFVNSISDMNEIRDNELIQILVDQPTDQKEELERLFNFACQRLKRDFSRSLTRSAAIIAKRIGKIAELELALLQSEELQNEIQEVKRRDPSHPMLRDMRIFFTDLGLDNLVKKLEFE